MGCGASAARAVESPHALPGGPPAAQLEKQQPSSILDPPEAAPVSTALPAGALAGGGQDELEGLLAALEAQAAPQSSPRPDSPSATLLRGAGEQRRDAPPQGGDLDQLLSELEAPPHKHPSPRKPELRARNGPTPGMDPALAPPSPWTMPQPTPVRQLAPLKISGRAPTSAAVAAPPASGPLQGFTLAGSPGVRLRSPGAMHSPEGGPSWAVELDPLASATLRSIHAEAGGVAFSRTPSVGSPSSATTTYITFDLLPDGATAASSSVGPGGGKPALGATAAVGREEVGRWGESGSARAGLQETAAEVDELLRDVFEDEEQGQLGRGAGPAAAMHPRWGSELGGGESKRRESSGNREGLLRMERRSSGRTDGGESSSGAATSPAERAGPVWVPGAASGAAVGGPEGPASTWWPADSNLAGGMKHPANQTKALGAHALRSSGNDLSRGDGAREPAGWQEGGEAGGSVTREAAEGDCLLDWDDLEALAREDEAQGVAARQETLGGNAGGNRSGRLPEHGPASGRPESVDEREQWPGLGRHSWRSEQRLSIGAGDYEEEVDVDVDTTELGDDG